MSSFKKIGGRYGQHSGSARYKNLQVDKELFIGNQSITAINRPGKTYYVDRNHNGAGSSGDGSSWDQAFLTIGEAVAKVNADYTAAGNGDSRGRNRTILVAEGWYGEVPMTLTADDVHIIGVAPGSHDSVVLYGSATAGGFDIGAGGPALQLTCSNSTIENMSFFTHDVLYASIQDGGHSGDGHLAATANSYNNKIINCNFIRDVDGGALGGIDCVSQEGPIIEGCTFSTSCKDFGIRIRTNGVVNPVNVGVYNCRFTGTPIGVDANEGHNTVVMGSFFMDDTSDRPGTITSAVDSTGATNTAVMECYSEFSNANVLVGGTSPLAINNFFLATPA